MLPEIQFRLRRTFRKLDPASREEAVQEATVHCALAVARLHEGGRIGVATPSSLAYYSARQVKCGRPSVGRMNGKEPLSRYAQLGNERIRADGEQWIDGLINNSSRRSS